MCSLQNSWLLCKLVSTCKPLLPSTVCPAWCLEARLCILLHQPPFPAVLRVGAPKGGSGEQGERWGHGFPTPPGFSALLAIASAFIVTAPARAPPPTVLFPPLASAAQDGYGFTPLPVGAPHCPLSSLISAHTSVSRLSI